MPDGSVCRTHHEETVAAPAGVVYGLIADAVQWPLFFQPNIHVEQLEFDGSRERLRMWATANGEVKSWTSHRSLDAENRRVDFRQEVTAHPVESMRGTWLVEPLGPEKARLTLEHAFTVTDDREDDLAWVKRATVTNTRAQMANIRELAERWTRLDELVLCCEDSIRVAGAPELVYDFLYRVAVWPDLLPHVSRVDVAEDAPGVQVMVMDSLMGDGDTYTTESVRVCFPHAGRIVYKQTAPPAMLAAHTGEWYVEPDESGVTVTALHRIVLHEEYIEKMLGEGTDIATARRRLRGELGRSSLATLGLAKKYAENSVRIL